MEKLHKWINEIDNFQHCCEILKQKEENVLSPVLTDRGKIHLILDWILDICQDNPHVVLQPFRPTDYYLLICSLLYSPKVFAGEFMERGLRQQFARQLGVSNSHISNSIRKIREWYRYYIDFKQSADYLFIEITERIKVHELN